MLVLLLFACRATLDTGDFDADGYTTEDCGPNDRLSFPGAMEQCDGLDNDCDGVVDEIFDLDQDGFLADDEAGCRTLGVPLDCNDVDPDIHPDAEETCDGLDNDCSGMVDDAVDADADGANLCEDCDDDDPDRSPYFEDVCDGLDNDCDGAVDGPDDHDGDGLGECLDCDDSDPLNREGFEETCDGQDNDCDGFVDEGFDLDDDGFTTCQGDCDDDDDTVFPDAPELCDGLDNDCDAETIEDEDLDGDGARVCDNDCDDDDALVYPGADEGCNGIDDDCNGVVDDALSCWGCSDEPPYLYCSTQADWWTAEDMCEAFDTTLATVDDAAENDALRTRGQQLFGHFWIGLNDHDVEGSFVWIDGSEPTYTNWHSGEPNDYSTGEDCTQVWVNHNTWNDAKCTSELPFVCEAAPQ
jgi:hypothetical protein